VDLVDEQDVAAGERRENAHQVALALQRRPRRHAHLGSHLVAEQIRQRGLAKAGRPRQQHVVERIAALARRLDVDRQVLGHLALADELAEGARSQCRVVVGRALVAVRVGRDHASSARARVHCRLRSLVVAFS